MYFIDDNSEVDIPIFRTEEGRYLASCKYRLSCLLYILYTYIFIEINITKYILQHWVIP